MNVSRKKTLYGSRLFAAGEMRVKTNIKIQPLNTKGSDDTYDPIGRHVAACDGVCVCVRADDRL